MKVLRQYALALSVLLMMCTPQAQAQQPVPQQRMIVRPPPNAPAAAAKVRLNDRFHQLQNQYATLKPKTLVNVQLRSTHPSLKPTQSNIVSTRQEIDGLERDIKSKLDSMSEMGETESLRLQMAMDRMSKLMETLSNLLKKISDTESSITQNMK